MALTLVPENIYPLLFHSPFDRKSDIKFNAADVNLENVSSDDPSLQALAVELKNLYGVELCFDDAEIHRVYALHPSTFDNLWMVAKLYARKGYKEKILSLCKEAKNEENLFSAEELLASAPFQATV